MSCDDVDDEVPSDVDCNDEDNDQLSVESETEQNSSSAVVSSSIISAPKLAFRHRKAAHPPLRPISPLRDVNSGSTIECCEVVVEETPVRTGGASSTGFRALRWQQQPPSRDASFIVAPPVLSDEEVVDEEV